MGCTNTFVQAVYTCTYIGFVGLGGPKVGLCPPKCYKMLSPSAAPVYVCRIPILDDFILFQHIMSIIPIQITYLCSYGQLCKRYMSNIIIPDE